MPQKGILVDRDGVLIENRADYVKNVSEVELIPGVAGADHPADLWRMYELPIDLRGKLLMIDNDMHVLQIPRR